MSDVLVDADLPEVPDLADEAVHRRLGPGALRVFLNIMDAWQAPRIENPADPRHRAGDQDRRPWITGMIRDVLVLRTA